MCTAGFSFGRDPLDTGGSLSLLSLSAVSPSLPQSPLTEASRLRFGVPSSPLISLVDFSQFHDFRFHKSVTI